MNPSLSQNLGRNDPCWCGSGKKYKNCHLPADQNDAALRKQKDSLLEMLGRFALQRKYEAELRQAGKLFFGVERAPEPSDDAEEWEHFERALDYFMFDYVLPDGKRIVERFAEQERKYLTPPQRVWLDNWKHALLLPLEVLEVQPGQGVRVRDILTGEEYEVRERRGSETILRWEIVYLRLMPMGDHYEFGGLGLHLPVSYFGLLRRFVNDLWLDYELHHREGSLKEFHHSTSHLLNRFILNDIGGETSQTPILTTPEGDLMARCHATYDVLDPVAAREQLRAQPALEEAQENPGAGHVLIWHEDDEARGLLQKQGLPFVAKPVIEQERGGRRILGTLTLYPQTMELDAVSLRRLNAFKQWLEGLLGSAIRHRRDDVTSLTELLAQTAADEPEMESESEESEGIDTAERQVRSLDVTGADGLPSVSLTPPELQAFADQYRADYNRSWIDLEIPALQGATPREAVKTLAGRVRVIRLLKLFEQREARRATNSGARFDWGVLAAELGLSEQEFREEARLEDRVKARLDQLSEHCINDELDQAWAVWHQFRADYALTSVDDIDFGQAWLLTDELSDAVMSFEYRLAMFKRFDEARALLDEYIALGPDDEAWARVEQEVLRAERGEIGAALAGLEELAHDEEYEFEALLELAEIQFNLLEQPDAALETLRRVTEVAVDDEEYERVYDATLELYENAERYDEGEAYWHEENDSEAEDERDSTGLMRMLLARGDLARAAGLLEQIPHDEARAHFRGLLAARQGDPATARTYWQKELERASPDDWLGWHEWGDLHLWLREPERVLEIDPEEQLHHWAAYWMRALAYAQLGELDHARAEAERARWAMETRGRRIYASSTLREYRHFARALGLSDDALKALTLE